MRFDHYPGVLVGAAVVAAWVCAACVGCGKGELVTVPVKGTVTYNGAPLSSGTVSFHPVDPRTSRPAVGKINADGTYVASTTESNPGVVPGEYKISIAAQKTPVFEMSPRESARAAADNLLVPQRYTNPETSGLSATVAEGDGAKTLDLALVD